jgi:hypothetical protein
VSEYYVERRIWEGEYFSHVQADEYTVGRYTSGLLQRFDRKIGSCHSLAAAQQETGVETASAAKFKETGRTLLEQMPPGVEPKTTVIGVRLPARGVTFIPNRPAILTFHLRVPAPLLILG